MVLHANEMAKDADVFPGVFFTTEKAKIETLLKQQLASARYFVNYAGWSAGQLEDELERDSWVIADPEATNVFEDANGLWTKLMRKRVLSQWIDPTQIPDDPSVN